MNTKRHIARLAGWSIAVACTVLVLKTAAWWITGSVALYSDAVESVINVVTALLAWIEVRSAITSFGTAGPVITPAVSSLANQPLPTATYAPPANKTNANTKISNFFSKGRTP